MEGMVYPAFRLFVISLEYTFRIYFLWHEREQAGERYSMPLITLLRSSRLPPGQES